VFSSSMALSTSSCCLWCAPVVATIHSDARLMLYRQSVRHVVSPLSTSLPPAVERLPPAQAVIAAPCRMSSMRQYARLQILMAIPAGGEVWVVAEKQLATPRVYARRQWCGG